MDVLARIVELREEKNWSEYRLSLETGIPQSTISYWFRKNVQPSVAAIEAICDACGITVAQFFTEDRKACAYLSERQDQLLSGFAHLTNEQQAALIDFLHTLRH